MAVITEAALVARIRRELKDYPWQDKLTSGYTAASGQISTNNPTMWGEGDVAEVDDASGLLMRVTATPTTNPISVQAGFRNTTDANKASGVYLLKNPRFEYQDIAEQLEREIDTLWPDGYVVATTTLTPVSGTYVYAVPSDFLAPISLVQLRLNALKTDRGGYVTYGSRGSALPVSPRRGLPTGDFAGGNAIELNRLDNFTNGIALTYAALPTTSTIQDGFMADALAFGAVMRCMKNADIRRVGDDVSQGDQAVQPGSAIRDASWFEQKRLRARRELRAYLRRISPVMPEWKGSPVYQPWVR